MRNKQLFNYYDGLEDLAYDATRIRAEIKKFLEV